MHELRHVPSMTIKEFGRLSGLSHKALRLYDMSGLLSPAEVVPTSGYRFYSHDQLERARRISMLRQLDMPLVTVAEVLGGTDTEAAHRLAQWWSQQEATMRSKRAAYGYVRSRIALGEADLEIPTPMYPISVRSLPSVKIATCTREVDQQALVPTMIESEQRIRDHLASTGASAGTDRWVLFHGFVTPDSEAPIEVCVPFEGTVDPADDITIRIEPAHTQAYCTVPRDDCYFPQILIAYEGVTDWIAANRRTVAGPSREMYFACWEDIAGTDPFVHVAQPIVHQTDRSTDHA